LWKWILIEDVGVEVVEDDEIGLMVEMLKLLYILKRWKRCTRAFEC
jgi:hypothetical protein